MGQLDTVLQAAIRDRDSARREVRLFSFFHCPDHSAQCVCVCVCVCVHVCVCCLAGVFSTAECQFVVAGQGVSQVQYILYYPLIIYYRCMYILQCIYM